MNTIGKGTNTRSRKQPTTLPSAAYTQHKEECTATMVYKRMVAAHGNNVIGITVHQQAKWLMEQLDFVKLKPAYLNAHGIDYWEHVIETGQIQHMDW